MCVIIYISLKPMEFMYFNFNISVNFRFDDDLCKDLTIKLNSLNDVIREHQKRNAAVQKAQEVKVLSQNFFTFSKEYGFWE